MRFIKKIFYKLTMISIILGFFVNSFSNFPFKKLQASLGNLKSEEVVLNDEYVIQTDTLMNEIEQMRTENSKVFKTNNGLFEYHLYNDLVHRYDKELGYVEIDSSFKEELNEYTSNSIDYNVKMPKKITSNKKIKLSYKNTKLDITYNNITKQDAIIIKDTSDDISNINRLKGMAKYFNVYDSVDLELISNSTSFKENIILNKYIDNFSFSYNISISNLVLKEENKYINFYNDDNKLIYQINPYFMIDSSSNISYEIEVKIEEIKKNNYQITIIPNNEYLQNATYPVIIDPTIRYNDNLYTQRVNIKTFIKGNITSNTSNEVVLSKYIDSVTKEDLSKLSIMKIDISSLPNNVMYSSAELRMYAVTENLNIQIVKLNNITSSNFNFDTVHGNTSYSKSYLSTQEHKSSNYYSFDILKAVKADTDNILYLEFNPELFVTMDSEVRFYGNTLSLYKPDLIFKYYETSGLKDYWTYHSSDMGNSGTVYTNDFTGNLIIERKDYLNDTERMSFNLVSYYNSSESDVNLGYGNGWRFNYNEFINNFTSVVGITSTNYYTHTDGTGHKSYYKFSRQLNDNDHASGLYLSEEGDDSQIEIGSSYNDYYRRIVNGDYIYRYNTYRELIYIEKINSTINSSITINYMELANGQRVISYVEDYIGNKAEFVYTNNLLSEIIISKKQIVNETPQFQQASKLKYYYDDENNLTRVEKYNKENSKETIEASYSYDDYNKLVVVHKDLGNYDYKSLNIIYDSDNKKVTNLYYSLYTDQTYNNFIEMEIEYGYQYTKFISSDGYETTYTFDRFGHTINVYDNEGYAKFYKYEYDNENENNYLNNKILKESEPVYYKYNRITNHGFENYNLNNNIIGWITSGDVTLEGGYKAYGEYSVKLNKNYSSISQNVKLGGNTTYQLLFFSRVKDIVNTTNDSLILEINVYDSSGNNMLNMYDEITPNDTFENHITNFTIRGNEYELYDVQIKFFAIQDSVAYIDNVQFISGINDCRYNMLEDSSFESSNNSTNSKWTGGTTYQRTSSDIFGNYNRYISKNTTLKQIIDVYIPCNTILAFGGFVNTNNNNVSIRLRYYDAISNQYSNYYTIKYNKEITGYQFIIESIKLDETFTNGCTQIEFEVVNNGNSNIYVDNLLLMQDIFTNKYSYNDIGKPVTVESSNEIIEYTRENSRDIDEISITSKKTNQATIVNIDEASDNNSKQYTASLNNISVMNYTTRDTKNSYNVIGTINTQFFVTSTEKSGEYLYQYITKKTDEFGNSTTCEYDYLTGLITKITDAKNIDTTYSYDIYNKLLNITKITNVVNYTYNNNNQIETITLGDNNLYITYKFEYNNYLDISKISYTSNKESGYYTIVEYEYYLKDGMYTGEISKIINSDGSYISYTYDNNYRIKEVYKKLSTELQENLVTKYIYNEMNNISLYYDLRTNTTYYYSYNLNNNLAQIIDTKDNIVNYSYNDNQDLTEIEYTIDDTAYTIEYVYDDKGNVLSIKQNGIISLYTQTSDPLGRYFEKIVKNDDNTILTYNYEYHNSINTIPDVHTEFTDNLSSNKIKTQTIITNNKKYKYTYEYDQYGNIIEYTEEVLSLNDITNSKLIYTYEYDNLNQLTKESIYNTFIQDGFLLYRCAYTYDKLGNMLTSTPLLKTGAYTELPSNYIYSYLNIKDKTSLTSFTTENNTVNLTYDIYNNLTTYKNYDIIFNEGKITTLSKNNIDEIKYTYDARGNRIKKEVYNYTTSTYDVIEYVYLDNMLIKEKYSDKEITYIYDEQNVIGFKIKQNNIESTYYYIKNLQQDVLKIIDENGNEVFTYIYDAYGNIVNKSDVENNTIAKLNPYRYKSYYYDEETGMFWLSSRYYSPELCRFISPDSIDYLDPSSINGLNLYCYCMNNPVMYKQGPVSYGGSIISSSISVGGSTAGVINTSAIKRLSKSVSASRNGFNLFGYELRQSAGWDTSPEIATGFFGRIGFSSYITHTKGQSGMVYAFAGSTSDVMNWFGTTYYAGLGINLFDVVGAEVYLQTIGIGTTINIGRLSIGADINLIGGTSITLGWNTDLGNGITKTDGFTVGINTGALVAIIVWIYKLATTGDPSPVPGILPA